MFITAVCVLFFDQNELNFVAINHELVPRFSSLFLFQANLVPNLTAHGVRKYSSSTRPCLKVAEHSF